MRPARRIVSSVPSIASSATAARCFTTAVWPRSIPASARATVSPYPTSFLSSRVGLAAGHRPRERQLVGEERHRGQQRDAVPPERVRDGADQAVGVLEGEAGEDAQELQVGHDVREDLPVLDLPGHDRLAGARLLQDRDRPAELAEADPVDLVHLGLELGRRLLADGQRHDPPARAPGARGGEEGEAAVAGDEPERLARPRRRGVVPHRGYGSASPAGRRAGDRG